MIAAEPRCAVEGCDEDRAGARGGHLGAYCYSHRYWQPVDHPERACPGCDEAFKPRRSDQVYCSRRCRHRIEARRNYVPRPKLAPRRRQLVCSVCGVTYLGAWGRYCSPRCINKAWKERHRGDYLEGKARHRQAAKARGAEWIR